MVKALPQSAEPTAPSERECIIVYIETRALRSARVFLRYRKEKSYGRGKCGNTGVAKGWRY